MRRKDREITDKNEIYSIMREASVCRLGFIDKDMPYVVPMSFGVAEGWLYLHSAKAGRKIDLLKLNNNICFEVDMQQQIVAAEKACNFSTKYKSVIGWGKVFFIEDADEKVKALNIIMDKYSGRSDYEYTEHDLESVCIIKIEINNITGKKSG